MLVKSLIEVSSRGKNPKIFCRKNDILNIISDHGNVLIVHKNDSFAIKKSNTESVDMTKEKLLEAVKETIKRTKDPDFFPYQILMGIIQRNNYPKEFAELVKNSDIQVEIKTRILDDIERQICN